ncbi:hypothetical protein BN7_3351 [Wickerhamomyces ciferrii]|uniref:Serine/threonine-protein kinase RIO1 n=1 Tax=Wickerhamomyces ciferrii (strain ATCC 14091 / BCRC 22168 / CBS 111 / JCM 3599 / NBRC 0793 / NRRL Y-1031 F-60-10) TaxID=1206466 RepID=K0KNR4_WICCF|nr:uncharacterized protein BN7_3351 [Wickerhamomyces ciferrii]CCH43797.1 hypothetical protein BN7_3351 [Wickerhamomyces ciferrii]
MSDLEEKVEQLDIVDSGSDSEDSGFSDEEISTSNNGSSNNNSSSVTTSKQTVDKAKILQKYSDKIKTDEFLFKQKQLSKDKADRATVENVLDPRTIGFIIKLIKKGTITKINGCLSTGKEANVYHAVNDQTEKEYAVKIYKTSILVFKDRERYVDGEFRFRNSRSQHNPRKMIKIWAEKEFRNLKRLYTMGMQSPEPIDLKSHVLVMEFLSRGDGFPSPKLRDYNFADLDEITHFYYLMIHDIRYMFQKSRLVHADLSEYNSIVHQGKLYIFDVSQSVEPEHPMSLDFLRMDIKNVNDFFMKKGIYIIPERLIFKFVIEDFKTLGLDGVTHDDKDEILEFIKNMPKKTTEEEVENDEIFRSLHLVRSLNHLEERDFEKFRSGEIDVLKSLDAEGEKADSEDDEDEDEDEDSEEDDEDSGDDEDEEDEESESKPKKKWVERPVELKGKKHEDKDDKKLRKQQAKEEAKEKRKTKMKKHVKKKLVNKGKK